MSTREGTLEARGPTADTISVAEASARLGVHEKTVRRAIDRGELEAIRIGRRVVIPRHVILSALAGQQREGGS